MSDLADFVLDFCRAFGGIVEPPAYGVHDVLLPEAVAAQLSVEPLQRLAFDETATGEPFTLLSYGHPLVERMVELAAASPACARLFITDVRLDKTSLPALARATLSLSNASLMEVSGAIPSRALFRVVRFNFRAALISDEKHEHLTTVLMDTQTGTAVPDFTPAVVLQLTETPAYTGLPFAPVAGSWFQPAGRAAGDDAGSSDPLTPELLSALLNRAAQAVADAMAGPLAAQRDRAARLLELDRARLDAYYADLERDVERRQARASGEARRSSLEGKLAATRADHAAKLADAEAKHRLRLELDLLNLAVIAQPKLIFAMRAENRQAGVTRPVVWDPLRRVIEPWTCDVCGRPNSKLFMCANGHLACDRCLAPQCVDCKRVYCSSCAAELTTCVVCGRPVCRKSLTRCSECRRGTCREHAGQCHAPAPQATSGQVPPDEAQTTALAPETAEQPARRRARAARPAAAKLATPAPSRSARERNAQPPAPRHEYRLQVEVRTDEPLVVAFVLTREGAEFAQRSWRPTPGGLQVTCFCERGSRCPWADKVLALEQPARVEAQLQAEIDRFRVEYQIPPYRAGIYALERGEFIRLQRLELHGAWKDRSRLGPEAVAGAIQGTKPAAAPISYPKWLLDLEPVEVERVMPEVERFIYIAFGWLVYEGALLANELAALTAQVAQPGKWYAAEHALGLFRAEPRFRVARGNVVALDQVEHPLKVMKEKAARGLVPRSFTAEELLVAAAGPLPLTPREQEIEQALNRRGSRRIYLRSVQGLMRNASNPGQLVRSLLELCAPADEPQARELVALLGELWNATPRYELRGRTPDDVRAEWGRGAEASSP
jgi:hypothetical protein